MKQKVCRIGYKSYTTKKIAGEILLHSNPFFQTIYPQKDTFINDKSLYFYFSAAPAHPRTFTILCLTKVLMLSLAGVRYCLGSK